MTLFQSEHKILYHLHLFILIISASIWVFFCLLLFFFFTRGLCKAPLLSFRFIPAFDVSELVSSHFLRLSRALSHLNFYVFFNFTLHLFLLYFGIIPTFDFREFRTFQTFLHVSTLRCLIQSQRPEQCDV